MKDIAKQYSLLTTDERFRLFVEAMGRRDDRELDQLENTCPRRTYLMQDYDYTNRKMYFAVLAFGTALCALRDETFCQLALIAVLAHDNENEGNSETAEKALTVFRQLMRIREGRRNGWLRFCDEIGVNPDAITKPFLDGTQWAMQTAEAAWEASEADCDENPSDSEEVAARELEMLLDAWHARCD